MRENQSHLEVSGPVVLRSMPKTSGFLLVFLLLASVCGVMQCFIFKGTSAIIFTVMGKKLTSAIEPTS